MQRTKNWQVLKFGFVSLAIAGLSACPTVRQRALSNQAPAPAIPVAQTAIAPSEVRPAEPQAVSFEVCADLPDWQRPDMDTQKSTLTENPRYGGELEAEPLKSLFDKFWNESIITFTTYGLSARMEPVNMSGLWTVIDDIGTCYEGDRAEAINQQQWAEVWLIGHRVVSVDRFEDQYQLTVEPTARGFQAVHFERFETDETLPMIVVEAGGEAIAYASGDWSE